MARPIKTPQKKGDALWCNKCKLYKSKSEFNKNPQREKDREGHHAHCKECCSEIARKRRQTLHKNSLDRLLKERLNALKGRCRNNGWVTDITLQYLHELLEKQDGMCAISGVKMSHYIGESRIPTNISVDRIDSKQGYIKSNVQLVCMAVNQMKNDMSIEQLIYFCNQIINNYESNNNRLS